jgi:hypothetical protein
MHHYNHLGNAQAEFQGPSVEPEPSAKPFERFLVDLVETNHDNRGNVQLNSFIQSASKTDLRQLRKVYKKRSLIRVTANHYKHEFLNDAASPKSLIPFAIIAEVTTFPAEYLVDAGIRMEDLELDDK